MATIWLISIIWKNFKLLTLPKFGVSGFLSVDRNRISQSAIMKKLKNGYHLVNIDHTEKFQITDHPKVWVSSFLSVDRNRNIIGKLEMKIFLFSEFSIGSFFPITHPRLHFNIYAWLHLNIYAWDIYAWFTSHLDLCVVLHFLIFTLLTDLHQLRDIYIIDWPPSVEGSPSLPGTPSLPPSRAAALCSLSDSFCFAWINKQRIFI